MIKNHLNSAPAKMSKIATEIANKKNCLEIFPKISTKKYTKKLYNFEIFYFACIRKEKF